MSPIFTLEALRARHGDALILHHGTTEPPSLAIIDGGPSGVWAEALRPRLEQIRSRLVPDGVLAIELAMVSHLDDDHIRGILDMSNHLIELRDRRQPAPWTIDTLWLNYFDDVLRTVPPELAKPATTAALASLVQSTGDPAERAAAAMLLSVPQGRTLRDNARGLQWADNQPFDGLILAGDDGNAAQARWGDSVTVTVIGPSRAQLDALQARWDEFLEQQAVKEESERSAQLAAFVDKSVFNLSSIVCLVEAHGKRMLLTGDARGDHVLESLRARGLLNGKLHVDLLKLPHHGSDNNVDPSFFEQITADHYVISGDGGYDNPERATLDMLVDARGTDEYTIHLTYRQGKRGLERKLDEFLAARKADARYNVVFPEPDALSVRVDLLDPIQV